MTYVQRIGGAHRLKVKTLEHLGDGASDSEAQASSTTLNKMSATLMIGRGNQH